ncbi:hypothetical protein ABW20_dc0100702 [Dactylellina cionopaga]|nr:hypothetical protein ABW20_dc0100702 [Dactylellina cionopaga]
MRAALLSTLAVLVGLRPVSATNAPFYTWPNAHQTDQTKKPEILSHIETRLSLASRLGLSQFHSIGAGVNVYKLQRVSGSQRRILMDEDQVDGTVMITVGGVVDTTEFWNESPTFEVEDAPLFSDVGSLVKSLESQTEDILTSDAKSLYSNSNGGFVDVVSPVRTSGIDLSPDYNQWSLFEAAIGESEASRFKSNNPSDVDFFEEYMVLKSLADKTIEQVASERATIFIHIGSLETIARKDGVNSQKHKVASKLISSILNSVIKATGEYPSIIGLVPPEPKNAKRGEDIDLVGDFDIKLVKRKEAPLSPTHLPKFAADEDSSIVTPLKAKKGKIVRPRPGCFESREICGNTTNSCNGRGNCIKSTTQSNCWSCTCKPTVVKVNGMNQTTYWGGNACHKQDVSVPFLLFVTFAIGLTLLVAWTISKMISMGEEELPGELSAGVAIVRK